MYIYMNTYIRIYADMLAYINVDIGIWIYVKKKKKHSDVGMILKDIHTESLPKGNIRKGTRSKILIKG